MNGQDPQDNQVKPDFGGTTETPPISFNPQFGFGNQNQPAEPWSPSAIPTPGPITASQPVIPVAQTNIPQPSVAPAVPMPQPIAPSPVFPAAMAQPTPTPTPMPTAIPSPAPIAPTSVSVPPVEMPPVPSFPTSTMSVGMPTASQAFSGSVPTPSVSQTPTFSASSVQEASVPASPTAPQFDIRTMQSDAASVRASGGGEPAPQTFSPAAFSGVSAEAQAAAPAAAPVSGKSSASKIIIAISVIALLGAALAAGFLILKSRPVTPVSEVPTPVAPAVQEAPITTETPVVTTPETPTAPQIRGTHKSLFTVKPDISEDRVIASVSLADIMGAIYPKEFATYPQNSIRELALKTEKDGYINFVDFLTVILPDLSVNKDSYKNIFDDDFTLFVYKGKTIGTPGFIVKIKPGVEQKTLDDFGAKLEASANLKNFYSIDPGKHDPFTSGIINSQPARLGLFPEPGFGFDYGWLKAQDGSTYLLLSASYNGFKEALNRASL